MIAMAPNNLNELYQSLSLMTKTSKIIGGGTDLVLSMRLGKTEPDHLLYMGNVKESHGIELHDDVLSIGSSVTITEIAESPVILQNFAALHEGASDIGSAQIRNKATIGGNIANASPAGDLIPVLCLLGAHAHIADSNGSTKIIDIDQLFIGAGKTILQPDQAIYKFDLPITQQISHFIKLGFRKKVTIARIGFALALDLSENKEIIDANMIVSAIAEKPISFKHITPMICGKKVSDPEVSYIIGEYLSQYIKKHTAKEFDRDYKASAIQGVVEDILKKY